MTAQQTQPLSSPLDVFATCDTDRKILSIFSSEIAKASPRKRKNATLFAVELLRGTRAPRFADALSQALFSIEKQEGGN